MLNKRVPLALSGVLILLLSAGLSVPSFAGCNVAIVSNIAPTDPNGTAATGQITVSTAGVPASLQRESTMERASDVLIFDDAAVAGGNCFAQGNKFVLSFNAALTSPSSIANASPANFDVYDSAGNSGGLVVAANSSMGFANTVVTLLEVNVLSPGTAAVAAGGITANPTGSALRIKNLRFDATPFANGANVTVTVSALSGLPTQVIRTIGSVFNTVAPGASVIQQGSGEQSSGATLSTPAIFDYAENYSGAFRVASNNASGVYADVATTATRVIFDLGTTLPRGVDVSFPALMQVGGTTGLTLTLRSGGTCSGPVQCTAVYDTTANGAGVFDLKTTTAAKPNTGEDGNLPAIGVFIENPSGFGTATLTVSLVPSHLTTVGDVPHQVLSIPMFGNGANVTGSGPAISAISPNAATAGAGLITLTVFGNNFTFSSIVQWNGSPRGTTFVSSSQLTAAISAADLAAAGSVSVTVVDGSVTSNATAFTISASPKTSLPLQYVLPHVISGNGYATRITLVNTSTQQNSVTLNFVSQAGAVLSSNTYNMAPGATVRVSMTDAERFGSSLTKWATVGSQATILANVWYDYIAAPGSSTVGNSVGFNDAAPITDFSLPAEFAPGITGVTYGKTVGLALANPNAVAAAATVKLVDANGNVVGTAVYALPAWGQTTVDISQSPAFAAALSSTGFVGSITVSGTSPLSSIAVQDNDGLFSAVPVGSGRAK